MDFQLTPSDHLSPPSTVSRFSDSDTPSECDIDSNRHSFERTADGASVSSFGSSSSPPTIDQTEMNLKFRKDLSPHTEIRKFPDQNVCFFFAAAFLSVINYNLFQLGEIQYSKSRHRYYLNNNRSHSPPPPEAYHVYSPDRQPYNYTKFQSRSTASTPIGSPKKRQLPQVIFKNFSGLMSFKNSKIFDINRFLKLSIRHFGNVSYTI